MIFFLIWCMLLHVLIKRLPLLDSEHYDVISQYDISFCSFVHKFTFFLRHRSDHTKYCQMMQVNGWSFSSIIFLLSSYTFILSILSYLQLKLTILERRTGVTSGNGDHMIFCLCVCVCASPCKLERAGSDS